MPQNPEKYFYVNRVGLLRGSWALKKFQEDAREHHMEDQPGKLVALRLTEYYELIERLGGAWTVPGAGANGTVVNSAKRQQLGLNSGSVVEGQEEEEDDDEPTTQPSASNNRNDPEEALDESIDYWTKI